MNRMGTTLAVVIGLILTVMVGCTIWNEYRQSKVEWMGNPVVRANALSKQADGKTVKIWTQGYLAGYDLGLRRDGVIVWRKTPVAKVVNRKK